MTEKKLWYKKEASVWEEALPIGNGRMGAMVYSGAVLDRLQINEDTLWSGYPGKEKRMHTMAELEKIRSMVKEKRYYEATKATSETMFNIHAQAYVPYGNIFVEAVNVGATVSEYTRKLDLANGIISCAYKLGSTEIKKKYFVSLKDDVLVININCSDRTDFHIFEAVDLEHKIYAKDGVLTAQGRCPTEISIYTNTVEYGDEESIRFCSGLSVTADAEMYSGGNSLWVTGAKKLTVVFSLRSSFNGYDKMPVSEGCEYIKPCMQQLYAAKAFSYEALEDRHTACYKKYFDRVYLEIDGESYDNIPTDERIRNAADGVADNGLVTLLFDYARYLMICSSTEGTQPANLQGIWCDKLIAPWHSHYTMNINTQMNYWIAEVCDLPECHMPYMKMLKDFCEKGNTFGLRGWSAWHNSDIWRFNYEATKDTLWGYWQMGGFWGVRHIWEHYIHTRDEAFLTEYYPVMTGACEFLEDWMIEDEDGRLTTSPSTSPENRFIYNGEICSVCEGSAMDLTIIYDVFDKTVKAGKHLGRDTSNFENLMQRLKHVKIGSDGRINEWNEEFEEYEPGHRHISHLYGFFPADVLSYEMYGAAVKRSLEVRLENGGGHTGWSNAWIAAVFARLGDSERVAAHIKNMFAKSIYPNMFDAHPPFQIDGNFGICRAICEALMQSHNGELKLLPALPAEWKSGEVRGMVTENGEKINFRWSNGQVEKVW